MEWKWPAVPRLSVAWRQALLVFVVIRVVASLVGFAGYPAVPPLPVNPVQGYAKPAYGKLFEVTYGHWERWDALWYLNIAQNGYGNGSHSAAFLPLYPMLIRATHFVTRLPWLVCAILVSNLALLLALWIFYRLGERELGIDGAQRATWYLALFPGAVFFLAPYTESLYLFFAVLAFWAARDERWWLAGLAAALLGATRNVGATIGLPLAVEFLRRYRTRPPEERRAMLPKAAWLLLCPLGTLACMAYWKLASGDALKFLTAQEGWQRKFSWPWTTFVDGVDQAWTYAMVFPGGVYSLEAFAVLFALVFGVLSFRKLPAAYGIFLWLNLLPPLFMPFFGRALMSGTRFVAILFPAFLTLAAYAHREEADRLVMALFTALFGLAVTLFVSSNWLY